MRLPDTAHTSRPWRIHELATDFRVEDVWALPTPGGPGEFARLVDVLASGDGLSRGSGSGASARVGAGSTANPFIGASGAIRA